MNRSLLLAKARFAICVAAIAAGAALLVAAVGHWWLIPAFF